MNLKTTPLLVITLLLQACSSMVWHEGSVIQYKNIEELNDNEYSMEVLGGWRHDQKILERAVLKKAQSLCNGEATILTSEMSTYHSSSTADGITYSGNPPKITSTVQCISSGS